MKKQQTFKWLGVTFSVLVICLMLNGPVMAKGNEILIGAPISMTGMMAPDGLEQKWAYEEAVADYNKKGGIFIKSAGKKLPIRLVISDDESEPAKVAMAMEKLIKLDKVDLMLSTHSGNLNIAAANAAEKYKMYYHITTAWPHMWSPHKFKWSSLIFFDAGGAAEVPFKIWETLPKSQRPKRPALVIEDSPDGAGFGAGLVKFMGDYGYKLAVNEPWAIGAKDYSAPILKMKAKKVDAILLFGAPTDAITLIRQIKEMELNVRYLHGWKGTWSGEVYEALGKDSNYVLCDGFWSEDFPYPGAKELGQRYTKKYNMYTVSIGAFYATAQTLLMAIEKNQSYDKTVIRDAFRNSEYKGTVMGDLKFDENGLSLITSTANQWWNGKQMLIYPAVKGGWKLRMAPDWGKR